jgi:hypothetical protein
MGEKVVCAEIELSPQYKKALGIHGFTMKASDIESFIEEEFRNTDNKSLTFKIKFSMKTKKWIEGLPEADI